MAGRASVDGSTLDGSGGAQPPPSGDDGELLGDTMRLGEGGGMAGTNEYEILTRLRRVPRSYEGASASAEATKASHQ